MKPVKDIMRNLPSSCGKNDNLQTVAYRMSFSHVEFLPVINEHGEVIGSITYNDVQRMMENKDGSKNDMCVADIMKTETHLINTNDDEAAALKLMRNHHTSYLPVVDDENHLKGVVSFVTLARRIIRLKQQLKKDSDRLKINGLGLSA